MTSKISFADMVKHCLGQRLWYGACMLLIFFLCLPLAALLRFSGNSQEIYAVTSAVTRWKDIQEEFRSLLAGGSFFTVFSLGAAALVAAWTGLSYLHSPRVLDMQYSLPVAREKTFLAEAAVSGILFAAAYGSNLMLTNLVGIVREIYQPDMILVSLTAFAIHILFFYAVYFTAAAAMLLSGKLFAGILGSFAFMLFLPGTVSLFQTLPGVFFCTWCGNSAVSEAIGEILRYSSPAYCLMVFWSRINGGLEADFWSSVMGDGGWEPIVCSLVVGVLIAVLDLWLARIRPQEAAGSSLAFPRTAGIWKLMFLPVLGLAGGLFFRSLSYRKEVVEKDLWFWFGILFVLIIGSILMEALYHFDRKRLLERKRWTAAAALLAAAVGLWFQQDLGGYDTFLPNPSDLESISVRFSSWNGWILTETGERMDVETYLKKEGMLEDVSSIYWLAEKGVELREAETSSSGETLENIQITYQMKNGRQKERGYQVSRTDLQKAEEELYSLEAYKNAIWPVLTADSSQLKVQQARDPWNSVHLADMGETETQQFVELYQKELASMSCRQMQEPVLAMVTFVENNNNNFMETEYPVNQYFSETLEFLKEKGLEPENSMEQMQITGIWVEYRGNRQTTDPAVEENSFYTNVPEEVRKLQENLVWKADLPLYSYKSRYDREVFVLADGINQHGEMVSVEYQYPVSDVPELVNERLHIR